MGYYSSLFILKYNSKLSCFKTFRLKNIKIAQFVDFDNAIKQVVIRTSDSHAIRKL